MYLVCYDILSNKYRKKVSDTLLNYGRRIQHSVFECDLEKQRYRKLCNELESLTKKCKEDVNVRIYEIGRDDYAKVVTFGTPDFISGEAERVIVI